MKAIHFPIYFPSWKINIDPDDPATGVGRIVSKKNSIFSSFPCPGSSIHLPEGRSTQRPNRQGSNPSRLDCTCPISPWNSHPCLSLMANSYSIPSNLNFLWIKWWKSSYFSQNCRHWTGHFSWIGWRDHLSRKPPFQWEDCPAGTPTLRAMNPMKDHPMEKPSVFRQKWDFYQRLPWKDPSILWPTKITGIHGHSQDMPLRFAPVSHGMNRLNYGHGQPRAV